MFNALRYVRNEDSFKNLKIPKAEQKSYNSVEWKFWWAICQTNQATG